MNEPAHTNRLKDEASPYLRQHAHNPVDWYPWGTEAFEAARHENKPIFLSIGYATCHWCHVMERESFEDQAIAALMNQVFINIKVDREEMPEVDAIYMEFAQAMLGQGAGWPLNVVLTPDLKPVFAATYLPPEGVQGQLGMVELVERIREIWEGEEREQMVSQAEEIANALVHRELPPGEGQMPTQALVDTVATLFYQLADTVYGGLQGEPKFPTAYQYLWMLAYSKWRHENRALFFVEKSLDMMQRGGIYDHLGGGFSRYSVDEEWMIPHFEKMLYDNALLASAYCAAWQTTRHPFYREICCETLDYVRRDMAHREGGFFSAEDADSEGVEGLYYTWSGEEILSLLGPEDGALFIDYYGMTAEGNFEGRNVLYVPQRIEPFAAARHLNPDELRPRLDRLRQVALKSRERRPRPFKDDKVITAWNGLMILAFAEAGWAFNEPRYIQSAVQGARFVRDNLFKDGHLLRRWRDGEAGLLAGLSDYAALIAALLTLFRIGGDSRWLKWAIELSETLYCEFKIEDGAFYETDGSDPSLLMRRVEFYDGAEPSGNAIHTLNLLRLYRLTGAEGYKLQAEEVMRASFHYVARQPLGGCYHCLAYLNAFDFKAPTLVVALSEEEAARRQIERAIAEKFLPNVEVVWRRVDDEELFNLLPAVRRQEPIDGKTTLYLCREGSCSEPQTDLQQILSTIGAL